MTVFTPTPAMVSAAEAVFTTMAMAQSIRPVVIAYQTEILRQGQWRIKPEFANRLGDEVITDPALSYLMSDENFTDYSAKCRAARDQAKLGEYNEDQCPLLMAEHLQIQAERALIDSMQSVTGLSAERFVPMSKRKEYIDLTLKLLAPFVRSATEIIGAQTDRSIAADAEFATYNFGDGVQVVESDNWNCDDETDLTKIVYVEYEGDPAGSASHKVSFHVRFNAAGKVTDAYALEMKHGNAIGQRGKTV